jgi:hypothetical protein
MAAALAALLLLFPAFPGAFGLFGPDEPRYASIAREMARSGDWVTPVLDGKPWLEKPALLYWMGAVGFKLGLGPEAAVRVPLGVLSAGFVVWFGWMVGSWRRAAMLATCAGWIGYSNIAVTDVPLAVCFSAGMVLALRWVETGRGAWWVGACLGAAMLAKGLVPVVLAAPVAWFARERWREWWKVVVASLVVAAPWYVLVTRAQGWAFINEFFIEHHFSRFASGDLQHVQPFWFYGPMLIGLLLPWTPLLWRGEWRTRAFYAAWLVFGFVFFSVSKNKLPGYLLPLLPAAVMVMRVPGPRYLAGAMGLMLAVVATAKLSYLPAKDGELTGRALARQVGPDSCANGIPRSLRYGVHYYAGKALGECWEMPGASLVPAGKAAVRKGLQFRVSGASGEGRLLFLAALRPTEGEWVAPVEAEPNLVWLGARDVRDWEAGETIGFDPNEIAYPGPFWGAGKGIWYWNLVFVRDGKVVARSATRKEVDWDPAADRVVEARLEPVEDPGWKRGWRTGFFGKLGRAADHFRVESLTAARWYFRKVAGLGKGRWTGSRGSGVVAWGTLWLYQHDPTLESGTMQVDNPVPLDFSNFYGVDLTKRPKQILFDAAGQPIPHPTIPGWTLREWALQDAVIDPHYGHWASMEYQFGPPTPEGFERPLFDRSTGEVDSAVLEHWLKNDLARLYVEKKIDARGITIRRPDAAALSFCRKTGARCVVD